jgi:hypothetical protein
MKSTTELKWQIGLPVAFFFLSLVLVTLLPPRIGVTLSTPEKIVIGGLFFCAPILIRIFWLASKVAARVEHEEKLWDLCEDCDTQLHNIRSCFVQIIRERYGPNDLFVTHFQKELDELAKKIKEVAERRQLRVRADHFLNVDNVLDAFQGARDRIWRYAWPIDGDHKLFDDLAWKRYFEKTTKMAKQREIKEIRTVLVLDDAKLFDSPRVQKLFDFFHTNEGFDCYTISAGDFRAICSDTGLSPNYIDFGIYGDILLFLTEQYEPDIVGVFSKDQATIKRYSHLFDSIWESAIARKNPSRTLEHVTLEELYAFDETEPFEGD